MKIRQIVDEYERKKQNAYEAISENKISMIGNDLTKEFFDYLDTEVEIKK